MTGFFSGRSTLLIAYLAAQGLALAGFSFIPQGQWVHAVWQTLVGWISGSFIIVGVRRYRPTTARAWYFVTAGTFISASGNLVETFVWRFFNVTTNPNAADAFWLALYPGLIVGLGILVYRRAAVEDLGKMMLNTSICLLLNLFLGILAWEFIVWHAQSDLTLTLYNRIVVTFYPLADLTLVALVVRLLLSGGGFRNWTVTIMTVSFVCFLLAYLGWSSFLRSGSSPPAGTQYLLEATSMSARALLGAAALHPDIRAVAPPVADPADRLGGLGWLGLLASILTAPLVLLLQAVLDIMYSVTSF